MKNVNRFSKLWILVAVLVTAGVFMAGCTVGKQTEVDKITNKAENIKTIIDNYYLPYVSSDAMEDGVYKGIMDSLNDPYSVYYTAEEYADLQEETTGNYVGVGVSVTQDTDTGYLKVVKVFDGGSAKDAGVESGDYITEVNGEDINGQDTDTVVSKIRGEEGTTVDVTFVSGTTKKSNTYTLERHSVDIPTVAYQMLDGDIGYIQISQFEGVTANQFAEALTDLENQGEKGLIIDLRDNPGGLLSSVVTICNNICPEGTIVYTKDKNGKGDTYSSDGKNEFTKPLVVLVNGNSASASEIFTGAVKDYGIGTIVGTNTFGKGIVQQLYSLGDGSYIKLTVSRYYTPSGVCIQGTGIAPDVEIEYDKEAMGDTYDISRDNQVDKAIEVIEEKLK